MSRARILALPVLAFLPVLAASPAFADASWGGIAYTQDGKTFKFYDYPSKEQVLEDAKTKLAEQAAVLLVQTGECGAVAVYHDAMGGMRVTAEKGHSLEEATHKALGLAPDAPDQDSEQASLLNSFCQG